MKTFTRVLPSHTEPMAKDFVAFLGGPPGRHAALGGAKWWTPLRVLLGTASFFLALAYMQKAPCVISKTADDGTVHLNWDGNRPYAAACYNDVIPLFGARGLQDLHFPYLYSWVEDDKTRYMEYPVLTGLHQYVAAHLGRVIHTVWDALHLPPIADAATYWMANCMILAVAWLLMVVAVVRLMGNRVWDTVVIVASPLVIVHAFTNWDVLSIAACIAGLYFWSRAKPGWAGAWLGLGVAFKLWPLFVFGAIGLWCLRNRTFDFMFRMIAGAFVAWAVVNLPIYYIAPQGWGEFYRMSSERGFEGSTIYQVFADVSKEVFGDQSAAYMWWWDQHNLNLVSMVLLLAMLGGLTLLVLGPAVRAVRNNRAGRHAGVPNVPAEDTSDAPATRAGRHAGVPNVPAEEPERAPAADPERASAADLERAPATVSDFIPTPSPRVAQLAFLATAAFLISNKVWSPQFSIWLLPLAVLALPRWRLVYTWAAVEAVFWYLRMWQFLPQGQNPPAALVDILILVRIALLIWMAVHIIRQIQGKEPDPVRDAHGGADPVAPWHQPAADAAGSPGPEGHGGVGGK